MENIGKIIGQVEEAAMAAVSEPFFVFDDQGKYVRIIGGKDRRRYHDGDHLIGRYIHEVIGTPQADAFLEQINRAIAAGEVITYEYSLAADDVEGSAGLPGPAGKQWFEAHISPVGPTSEPRPMVVWIAFNITALKTALLEKERLIEELQRAAQEIKTLKGILPICSHCKKIRDDRGYWNQLESYLSDHSDANLSHGICPECVDKFYADYKRS